MTYQERVSSLRRRLRELKSAVVAFSGGVDSSVLVVVAYEELKEKMCAATAISPSMPVRDQKLAITFCGERNIPHSLVETKEFENPVYNSNPNNRCFYCKSALYDRLTDVMHEKGFEHIVEGTNTSDLSTHRPGYRASCERTHVVTPLIDAGMTKEDVRRLARELSLPVADKPATACLASRVPEGVPLQPDLLKKIDDAEEVIRSYGITQVRVRHHGNLARIEVLPGDFNQCLKNHGAITKALNQLGYQFVTLDLLGYRCGGAAS